MNQTVPSETQILACQNVRESNKHGIRKPSTFKIFKLHCKRNNMKRLIKLFIVENLAQSKLGGRLAILRSWHLSCKVAKSFDFWCYTHQNYEVYEFHQIYIHPHGWSIFNLADILKHKYQRIITQKDSSIIQCLFLNPLAFFKIQFENLEVRCHTFAGFIVKIKIP